MTTPKQSDEGLREIRLQDYADQDLFALRANDDCMEGGSVLFDFCNAD